MVSACLLEITFFPVTLWWQYVPYCKCIKAHKNHLIYRSGTVLHGSNVSSVTKQHCLSSRASTARLTHEVPLSVGHVSRHICLLHLDVQQPAIKCPGAKLQFTALDVKWKPPYIHVTCADEYSLKSREKENWGNSLQRKWSKYHSQENSSQDVKTLD